MSKEKISEQTNKSKTAFSAAQNQEERELVSRLKAIIDRNGRYSYRLDDMAAGFAAGRGVTPMNARMEIERQFVETYERSPKQYMEQRYQELQKYRQHQPYQGKQDIEM